MPVYTIWSHEEDEGVTIVPGEGPPVLADGSLMLPRNDLLRRFTAQSWEEAVRQFDAWREEGII